MSHASSAGLGCKWLHLSRSVNGAWLRNGLGTAATDPGGHRKPAETKAYENRKATKSAIKRTPVCNSATTRCFYSSLLHRHCFVSTAGRTLAASQTLLDKSCTGKQTCVVCPRMRMTDRPKTQRLKEFRLGAQHLHPHTRTGAISKVPRNY